MRKPSAKPKPKAAAPIPLPELEKLAALQSTDAEIAAWFGLTEAEFAARQKSSAAIRESLKRGRLKGIVALRQSALSGKNRALFRSFARQYLNSAPPAPPARWKFEAKRGVSKKAAFLEAYIATAGQVVGAAEAVKIDRRLHYRWLDEDNVYAKAFQRAKLEAADVLEAEAVRRARDGVVEAVYHDGEVVGYQLRYSDGLMLGALRAKHPDWREKIAAELTGKDGEPIRVQDPAATTAVAGYLAALRAWGRKAGPEPGALVPGQTLPGDHGEAGASTGEPDPAGG